MALQRIRVPTTEKGRSRGWRRVVSSGDSGGDVSVREKRKSHNIHPAGAQAGDDKATEPRECAQISN